jgi:hypothetical protein
MDYDVIITEEEVVAIVTDENNSIVSDEVDNYTVKVFVAKGDKGDKGDPGTGGVWGSITGDINAQEDLTESLRTITDAINELDRKITSVYFDTTAGWAEQTSLVSEKNSIYVYIDYAVDSLGRDIAAFKVGDGKAFVVDLPFADSGLADHINNHHLHITDEERAFWNSKISCHMSQTQNETLVFTTD